MSHLVRTCTIASLLLLLTMTNAAPEPFDLVIAGGRVINPESGLDAVRHVGIRGDRIAELSEVPLQGRDTLDARGLVVAPGFIDLHRHAHGEGSYRFAARDGVTSVFELEVGTTDVEAWYRMMGPARLVNFGVAAGHIGARMQVLGDKGFMLPTGPGRGPASASQVADIVSLVASGLAEGGVAVGVGTAYTPGASREEIAAIVEVAAKYGAVVHAHLGGGVQALTPVFDLVGRTGASLHIAHVNSTAGRDIRAWLEAITDARRRRLDVTTEMYPYTAGATLIQSAVYDGWESWPDERFATLQWAATGERLTRQTFAKYRAQGGSVISHSNTEENLRIAIADPLPMFASDGGRDLADQPTHPRASGTFARILGHYVRDDKRLTLHDALRRMTIEPARRLERRVPEMRDRGRIRIGAYADITAFDAAAIADRSTYTNAAAYSGGIAHVIVNGLAVVRSGAFDETASLQGQQVHIGSRIPGRPIRAPRIAR
jgi:cytosine/adenosine deaminase-related metal-dependent hydrolase